MTSNDAPADQTADETADVPVFGSIADLEAAIGQEVGPTPWMEIEQSRIDGFADATLDHQWIHVDPARAAEGPFGTTIAHGFLTVSLVPYFVGQLRRVENVTMGVNYGLDKVRFPSPVPVGSKVRATMAMTSVDRIGDDAAQVVTRCTITAEDAAKPACVAELVARYYFAS